MGELGKRKTVNSTGRRCKRPIRTCPRTWACDHFTYAYVGFISCICLTSCARPYSHKLEMRLVMNPSHDAAQTFASKCEKGLSEVTQKLKALENSEGVPTVDHFLEDFNELLMLSDGWINKTGLYSAVHPDGDMRTIADRCEQEFKQVMTEIELSEKLYVKIQAIDLSTSDQATARYVEHVLRDFRRAGVNLDLATQGRIKQLKEELVKTGQLFSKNLREDVRLVTLESASDLAGLPGDYIEDHPANDEGQVTISTDSPDAIPFMLYAKSDEARLKLYKASRQRGYPKNIDVLEELLAKRNTLATLLGYRNWAHYATEDKMLNNAHDVQDFIEKIRETSKLRAKRDYDELLGQLRKIDPSAQKVGDWQKSYLEQELKAEKYDYDAQKVREYFSYGKTRDGLFGTTATMFDVEYRKIDTPVWHPSVESYELIDHGRVIGRFHLDMFPRPDKYKHAAAFPLVGGVRDRQLPEAVLVCNFPEDGPMEHHQVTTFFHEFGHLLHFVFGGQQRWIGVSGFNTEWDFVEVPSQLLEEWAWEAEVLKTFASNHKGEPIPDELVEAMRRARDFGKGVHVMHQMFYAALSFHLYSKSPDEEETTEVMQKLQLEYSPFDYVEDTYFHLSFGHLDGYSALYYTYMWSLVIAKDIFGEFKKDGLLNSDIAKHYREAILDPGGSRDAAIMLNDFLTRNHSYDRFAHWLNES
jgi:thimet oligopeptidase